MRVVRPLRLAEGPSGPVLSIDLDAELWIRLTGPPTADAGYPWEQVVGSRSAPGTWAARGRTGTTASDPAYEANRNTGLPAGTVVDARREPGTRRLRFQLDRCPAATPPPPSGTAGGVVLQGLGGPGLVVQGYGAGSGTPSGPTGGGPVLQGLGGPHLVIQGF